ncbi:polysaccharide deacetylase family protein [Cellulomonas hominis]|uniref:polysaccharide deacetylase family protein n=1 Tax=Cellulomonas hominis TaxID=156981 RepID=UPI001BCEF072|nr:polysaccharide deacetylase family protein [Cellulomonas hominis]
MPSPVPPRHRARAAGVPVAVLLFIAAVVVLRPGTTTAAAHGAHPVAAVAAVAPVATVVPEPDTLTPGTVTGLVARQSSTADPDDQRSLSTLAAPVCPNLDAALSQAVDAAVSRHEQSLSPGAGNALDVAQDAVLAADDVLGVRTTITEYTGGAHARTWRSSLYADVAQDRTWSSADLVTGGAALAALVGDAVRAADLAQEDPDPDEVARDLRFSDDGSLTVVLDGGVVAAPAAGVVAVRVAPSAVPPLLSDAGRTVRDAAASGAPPDVAAPETPAPTSTPAGARAAVPRPAVDCAVARCVALTFDDGPGPDTGTLLDELAARDVPATFFVVGRQAQAYPDLVAREHAEGHVIGNHTWTHPDLRTLGPEQVADELDRTARAVADATGEPPVLVRPPYGAVDDQLLSVLAGRGETAVLWDVDTEDWKNRDAAETARRALDGVHPGAIVLMHDVHPSTVQAVPALVDQLRAQGYTLVTVPELLGSEMQPGAELFRR